MKNKTATILIALTIAMLIAGFLTSCGYREGLRANCHITDTACDALFGSNTWEMQDQVDKNSTDITNLEKELESLKTTLDMTIKDVQSMQAQVTLNQAMINVLLSNPDIDYSDMINALQEQIDALNQQVSYQQTVINNFQVQLNNLASNDDVFEIYDPCGTSPGFNEVLLKTQSGKYIAYFESTGKSDRYLTVLQPGYNYQTTDGTKCLFSLDNDGNIVNERIK